MKKIKVLIPIFLVVSSLFCAGCNLFSEDRTRPAPVRPNPQIKNAPTKDVPGVKSLSEKELLQQITTVEKAVNTKDWSKANREGNTLGIDMARYRPDAPDGQSLRDMTRFNAIYTKLQADLKTKNKTACLKDLRNLREAMQNLNKEPE